MPGIRIYAVQVRLAWPLTGRSEEMRRIQAAIAARGSSGVFIHGTAGVGKSRLAREALVASEAQGREIRWAVASSSARALPLAAFAQWAGTAEGDSIDLVRNVIDALTSTSTDQPAVVGVDDVHLLDDLSAFVLHQIVVRDAAKVVLTIRDGERVPPSVREVHGAGQFERLDLQPLSRDETTALVATALDGPLEPNTAWRLWTLTRGNALYLRNIVDQEVGDQRLTRRHGCWVWVGDPVIPPDLAEMIESRIGTLPAPVADVLDTLAVGEPIALTALGKLTDAAAVEDAEARGLVTLDDVEGGIEVRIAHPLYGEVRRKRTASTRLRRLRALVAAELAASDSGDDVRMAVRRATLSLESDSEPDPVLLLRAARGATELAELPLADRLADAAIRAGAGAEANIIRAHVLGWMNRGPEADAVLRDCPTDGFADADHAKLAFLRANNMLWTLVDPQGAKQLIDEASRRVPAGSRDCIDAFLAVYLATMAKPRSAIAHFERLVLDQLPSVVFGETVSALVNTHGAVGRTSDACSAAQHAYELLNRSFEAPYMRSIITEMHVAALVLAGRLAEACEVADRLCQQAADLPGHAQSLSAAVAVRAELSTGHVDTACSTLREVVETVSAFGDTNAIHYHCQPRLTTALAMLGLHDDAAVALANLEKWRSPTRRYLDYERDIARAWVAACRGGVSEAIETLLAASETARQNGQFAVEVLCLQTATQFGDVGSASRLRELEQIVEGPRAGIAARFAVALVKGDASGLLAVARDFEHMGDLVAATDAVAHAAIICRRDQRQGSALTCSARANDLARRCGGVSTPALRKASVRLPFTDRECEIVMLIGHGLSSRAIADRLTLSVRTVEGHIYRAMAKTGAADRDELARMLPGAGERPRG